MINPELVVNMAAQTQFGLGVELEMKRYLQSHTNKQTYILILIIVVTVFAWLEDLVCKFPTLLALSPKNIN